MANDDDSALTHWEREFKRMHPETWKRMQAEAAAPARGDDGLTDEERRFKRLYPRTFDAAHPEVEARRLETARATAARQAEAARLDAEVDRRVRAKVAEFEAAAAADAREAEGEPDEGSALDQLMHQHGA